MPDRVGVEEKVGTLRVGAAVLDKLAEVLSEREIAALRDCETLPDDDFDTFVDGLALVVPDTGAL